MAAEGFRYLVKPDTGPPTTISFWTVTSEVRLALTASGR